MIYIQYLEYKALLDAKLGSTSDQYLIFGIYTNLDTKLVSISDAILVFGISLDDNLGRISDYNATIGRIREHNIKFGVAINAFQCIRKIIRLFY